MKGRKPIPRKIKALRGNPDRRKPKGQEPAPAPVIPTCPGHLSDAAKQEWLRIVPELSACGLLTQIDRAALAAYCQAYGRWVAAEAAMSKGGLGPVVMTDKGNLIQNPYLPVANRAMEQMRQFIIEFGMTPSSRSRVSIDAPKQDRLEQFLKIAK